MDYPEGFQRVSAALIERGHPHAPLWLEVAARTSQEAADALVGVGAFISGVLGRAPVSRAGKALLSKRTNSVQNAVNL